MLLLVVALGCGQDPAAAGGLGSDSKKKRYALDLDDLFEGEPKEIARALGMPHTEATRRLGPHRVVWEVQSAAYAAGKLLTRLDEKMTLVADSDGGIRIEHTNSESYGKEIIFVGGEFFVRGRWGPMIHRRPTTDEAERWRDDIWGTGAVYYRLLGKALSFGESGEEDVSGRSAWKLGVSVNPENADTPGAAATFDEEAPAKAWRNTIRVESASGAIWLDAKTGVPLRADLQLKYSAVRDGREARWTITLALAVDQIGTVAKVTPPEEFAESAVRRRMIIDRERVLGEKRRDLALMTDEELWAMVRGHDLDVPRGTERADLIKILRSYDPSLKDSVLVDEDRRGERPADVDSPIRTDIDLEGPTIASEEIPLEGDDDDDEAIDAEAIDDSPELKPLPDRTSSDAPPAPSGTKKDDEPKSKPESPSDESGERDDF